MRSISLKIALIPVFLLLIFIMAILNAGTVSAASSDVKYSPLFEASLQDSLNEFADKESGKYYEDILKDESGAVAYNPGSMPTSSYSCGYSCSSTCGSTCGYSCGYSCGSTCSTTCSTTCTSTCNYTCTATCTGNATCSGSITCVGTATCINGFTCIAGTTCPPATTTTPTPSTPSTPDTSSTPIPETTLPDYQSKYDEEADELNALGLFSGSNKGYELDKQTTRAEAAVMLVRLLGKEDEVADQNYTHPFTDVPKWANNYVGYLYENGITSGVSSTQYGSSQYVNYLQYTTFMLKALGYKDSDFKWNESDIMAEKIGLYSASEVTAMKDTFRRENMVHLSYQGLRSEVKGEGIRLIDKLIEEGSVTPSAYVNLDILDE